MNSIDHTPLYRNSVGFDRLASIVDKARNADAAASGYPPYNIELRDENKYAITLAVAGFDRNELDLVVEKGVLTVRGEKAQKEEHRFLHQGIAFRPFQRKFNLADHVEVRGADLENGLLIIHLAKEVPEEMKPKNIPINQVDSVLEHDRAAA